MKLELTDSHCHLQMGADSPQKLIDEARAVGVKTMLCVALNQEDRDVVVDIAQNHDDVYVAAAWHPNHEPGFIPSTEDVLALCDHEKIIAVGETGLDYFRSEQSHEEMQWQRDRFISHILASKANGKPLVIHTRDAMDETLDMIEQHGQGQVAGVMHCFTGTIEEAKRALDLGFYISFSGIATFNSAKEIREVIMHVPEDRFLIETDTPYLAPVPHRGKPNQPAYVIEVAALIAKLKDMDIETVAQQSTDNFKRLCGLAID